MERQIYKLNKDIQFLKTICQSPTKNINSDIEAKIHSVCNATTRTSTIPLRKIRKDNREMFELEKKVLLLQNELTLAKSEITNLNKELDR